MERVTMKDVAKMAGVTQPTVSHVLNNTAPISEAVKERVHKAIHTLGYTPNPIKKNKINIVGVIVPDITAGYYSQIVKTIESVLSMHSMIIFICNTFYDPVIEQKYVETLMDHNVSGIIVTYGFVDKNLNEKLIKNRIPLVALDERIENCDTNIPSIEMNNVEGGRLAATHLCSIGAKNICIVSEPLFDTALIRRFDGFKKGLKQFNVTLDETCCFIENNQYDKLDMGYNLGANILLNKSIDAVFATSDYVAFGVIRRLKEYDIRIPDDIMVMGYDDVPLSKVIYPELTTISQPSWEMARKGVSALIDLIKKSPIKKEEISLVLEPSLIIRRSTMRKIINY